MDSREYCDSIEVKPSQDVLHCLTLLFRSGFSLKDTVNFAESIEKMMRETLGVDADELVDEEEEVLDKEPPEGEDEEDVVEEDAPKDEL